MPQLARDTGVDAQARTFRPWSHVVSLLYAQLTHSLGLNDVCDALRLHSGPLSAIRGATPASKNAFSHANMDFTHLADLSRREVFWVTRAKTNLQCRVGRKFQDSPEGQIRRDDLIQLTNPDSKKAYPVELRRVMAKVEVEGNCAQWCSSPTT